MATLQQICDAFEAVAGGLTGLSFFSEQEESPNPPLGGVAADLRVEDCRLANNDGRSKAVIVIDVSRPKGSGWGEATRALRPYADMNGPLSIPAVLRAAVLPGGAFAALGATLGNIASGRERTVLYGDGQRRAVEISVEVLF